MAIKKNIDELKKLSLGEMPEKAISGQITLFKTWLNENYQIKVNELDVTDVYIEATENNPIQYQYDINESDIYLHAVEDGLKISRAIITNILNSPNQITHYNPIKEYFNNLKGKYKGPSQIDYLFSCLNIKKDEDYQKCQYLFRKWIYATAACVLGKRINDVALGLVSENAGIGKTTIFYEILPIEMRQYTTIVQRRSNPLLDNEQFINKIILNFDELSAVTPSNENQFKQLISSEKITVHQPASRRTKTADRIASVCFTSNKTKEQGGFIRGNDSGMLRRLAIIAIDSIKDYRESLDTQDLWAEAVTAVEGGIDYQWNQEDYEYLIQHNKAYIINTNAMKLVQQYYNKPMATEESEYKTATEIWNELKVERRIPSHMTNVDPVSIGQALNALGYDRKMKRINDVGPRYVYCINKQK